MNLRTLVQWVEIAANIAVVVSVIFLSLQVRNNTRVVESQSIQDRSKRINEPLINSTLIPSILQKIKTIDGPELLEARLMNKYHLTYEEAAVWSRHLTEIFVGLESEFLKKGSSQGLIDRIQLLFIFPDVIVVWADGKNPQFQSLEFIEFVSQVRKLPVGKKVSDYKKQLDSLKSIQMITIDSNEQ